MNEKICVITGANSGIGKQAAIQMAVKGYHVIIGCRNQQRGEIALKEIKAQSKNDQVELIIVDMSRKASIQSFSESLHQKFEKVDVLIHNAAVFDLTQKSPQITDEGYESIWMTNHIGPVTLTEQLLDLLRNSEDARILTISSKGLLAKPMLKVDLEDPEFKLRKFNGTNAYYQAKLAQVMYTYWLAKKLENENITVNAIRVPAVQVDITRMPNLSPFMKWAYQQKSKKSISPARMAETYTYLAAAPEMKGVTGKYINEHNQEVSSPAYTRDWNTISALMNLTSNYL